MIKYWGPIEEVINFVNNKIPDNCKVLELGPGIKPFSKSTHFCGWLDLEKKALSNYKVIDFSKDKFPYEDKEFDFVYARHVLEDLYNPFHCMDEMSRIAKSGFIECPSPIAEVCRDVENYIGNPKDKWRGYQHHHNFVWNDGVLNFLHKFPIIEFMKLENENDIYKKLEKPINWNTYYMWKDEIKYKNHTHPQDYHSPAHISYYELVMKGYNVTSEVNEFLEKEILK